jgi:hypothetical protein
MTILFLKLLNIVNPSAILDVKRFPNHTMNLRHYQLKAKRKKGIKKTGLLQNRKTVLQQLIFD